MKLKANTGGAAVAEAPDKPQETATVEGSETPVPFQVSEPGKKGSKSKAADGEKVQGEKKPSIVQLRQERIAETIRNGAPFTFKERRDNAPFTCICGATGKNAKVIVDRNGNELLVGDNCAKRLAVQIPKAPRKESTGARPGPGISRQQKMNEALAKYIPPFQFVRKQDGTFNCLCGSRGSNQIVVADANGTEFSVGETCSKTIPGVEIPKAVRQQTAPNVIAGLKGQVAEAPSFDNVG